MKKNKNPFQVDWDPIGKWNNRYEKYFPKTRSDFKGYGKTMSYVLGAIFLHDCERVEDWGCGYGMFKEFCLFNKYIGIDGSNTPAADHIVDLQNYKSSVNGVFLRHVLEHNPGGWRQILTNAIQSFSKKMVLVIYTPFGDQTRNIRKENPPDINVPFALSFRKADITDCFPSNVFWIAFSGEFLSKHETIFFLIKGDKRSARLTLYQDVCCDLMVDGVFD